MIEIEVTGPMTPARRRAMVERQNAELAATLIRAQGWDWFQAQCDKKAEVLERALLDMERHLDVRDEDRYRGAAEAFRSMPRMMISTVTNFNKKVVAQQAATTSKGN